MKRVVVALGLVLVSGAGCGDDDHGAADAAPISLADAAVPDAAPIPDAAPSPDAQLFELEPALGVDSLAIVGANPTFRALGQLVNDMLQQQIDSGLLLLALELRGLDDPAGQDDDALGVGFYACDDPDRQPADNFDPERPDRWVAQASSVGADGAPTVLFGTAAGGVLQAAGQGELRLPGLPLDLPLSAPELTGRLVPAPDGGSVHYLDAVQTKPDPVRAVLAGAVLAHGLAAQPNLAAMFGCRGDNLLDLLALGCEVTTPFPFTIVGAQPDQDVDGDGLERLCDTCADERCGGTGAGAAGVEADAAPPEPADGRISCCVDGDGTVVDGARCWAGDGFADGYRIELRIHATRIELLSAQQPPAAE
jgi:hypothetical protein